jgi:hypothetical protein
LEDSVVKDGKGYGMDTIEDSAPSYSKAEHLRALRLRDNFFHDPGGGVFDGKTWGFVLKNRYLNLWEPVRDAAVAYFKEYDIEWHRDKNGEPAEGPEGHLLSSNIACVNHLFPLRGNQRWASLVLRTIDSRIISAELIDGGYAAFEIIGGEDTNPLGEKNLNRKRGTKSTSVDAAMIGRKDNGKNILVLIEWKYTEKYEDQKCRYIDGYHQNYIDLLRDKDCPIIAPDDIKGLFYEPYYQLMRQTLLGWRMVTLNEYNCDEFVHLHVIPLENRELRRNLLVPLNWKNQLKSPEQYRIVSPDELLKPLESETDAGPLLDYLRTRYW